MKRVALEITGMSCAGCIERLGEILRGVSGVSAIDVSLGRAWVTFDEQRCAVSDLVSAIRGSGRFAVQGFSVKSQT